MSGDPTAKCSAASPISTTRLDDLAGPHLAERILVCRRGADLLIPWATIESFEQTGVLIHGNDDPTTFAITSTVGALADDEILLARDVLDTQIVDIAGRRMARVADVVLTRCANGRLELVGVDVGFAAVLRRLGLRRLAAHISEDIVAWTDLHLTSERGHAVQLATPRSAVHHLDAAALAALISRLDVESATEVLALRGPRVAADAIRAAPARRRARASGDARRSRRTDRGRHARRARNPLAGPHRAHADAAGTTIHPVPSVAPSSSRAGLW